jgi:hypothetical protein
MDSCACNFSDSRFSQMDTQPLRSGCDPRYCPPCFAHVHLARPVVPTGQGMTAVVPGRVHCCHERVRDRRGAQ